MLIVIIAQCTPTHGPIVAQKEVVETNVLFGSSYVVCGALGVLVGLTLLPVA